MNEVIEYLKVKRNLINILILLILVTAIPVGTELIKQQQILKSQAAGQPIEVVEDSCVSNKNGVLTAKCPDVKLRLTSPLGGPATAGQ